jgi:hypothetical protein
MKQQYADAVGLEWDDKLKARARVPNRHIRTEGAAPTSVAREPQPVAQLDLMRKVMLGVAGVLTVLWFALLAWGAVRLIGSVFF